MAEMTASEAIHRLFATIFIEDETRRKIAALLESQQRTIEALKCCGNCINWRNGNVMQCMLTYKVIGHKGKCDNWEGVSRDD